MDAASPPPPRHYALFCSSCNRRYDDDGLMLDCLADHPPALLRTRYADERFSPGFDHDSLFRYQRWLPVASMRPDDQGAGRTVVYRSRGLAGLLGLPNLWIAFNGYWPERGARLQTGTFKDLEAHAVLRRLPERRVVLTVASSGNTGAAFAWACSRQGQPCLIIIPAKSLHRFRFAEALQPCVNLVVIEDGDYPDAIDLAARASRLAPFQAEGGIKNVGRRDGLATVLLSAFEEMRRLPEYYFQAAGSGTGAIAVLEAAMRIQRATGEATTPRLMLCQNRPFTPIFDAWRANSGSVNGSSEQYRDAIKQVYADELTNWKPPYAVLGGVYDSLVASDGDVLATSNGSAEIAAEMFTDLEGIDIEPAAGVAVACLRTAATSGRIDREAVVLLNITGGGRRRLGRDHRAVPAEPRLRLTRDSLTSPATLDEIAARAS
jgi:cysteate synthase